MGGVEAAGSSWMSELETDRGLLGDEEDAFLAEDDVASETAVVIDRGDNMVIEIVEGGKPSYTIVGKRLGHFYAGGELNPPLGATRVRARWALLGDVYVGIWWEEERE